MKYACNISYELIELLNKNPSICDYIKIGAFGATKDMLDQAYTLKPLLIHGFGWHERGGMPSTKEIDYDKINQYIHKYKSPFIGIHSLCFPEDAKKIQSESVLEYMIQQFHRFDQQIHTELLIENMDFNPYYEYPTTLVDTVRPWFLRELIEQTGLGLLLDISHAKVSAYQLGMDIQTYLEGLPLEKIREIHFSGTKFDKKLGVIDVHGIMEAEDYRIARYLQQRLEHLPSNHLEMITLEYGTIVTGSTDPKAITDQIHQLKTIFM